MKSTKFSASQDRLRVFISSKMLELRDLREMLNLHLESKGLDAWIYEDDAGAQPDNIVQSSLHEVELADVYVGLFWKEYGKVTIDEYRYARQLEKPCFIYIRDKDISRDPQLEEFLKAEVFDPKTGVTYDYFDKPQPLVEQVSNDIMKWLIRQHRELTAKIQIESISEVEIERLQGIVDRLQATSRESLPQGDVVDLLSNEMRGWFRILGYTFEPYEFRSVDYFEWIINVPVRHRYERILVRGVVGEGNLAHYIEMKDSAGLHKVDEGWLVATRRISQAVREEAKNADNSWLLGYTFDELLDQNADFTGYLDWLERQIKERGIDKLYVPLAVIKEETDLKTKHKIGESIYDAKNGWIDGYIDLWLDDPSKEHISILGEFGTGKTWFTLHYAWKLLKKYQDAKKRGVERPRLPLVIPLRDYAKAVSVESLFSEFFFRKHEIPLPGYSAFAHLNRMGKFLLLFDGFDEMAARIDRQNMINNFWELAKVVTPGSKVILTCRTEYFPTATEGRSLLGAELSASTTQLTGEPPQFEVLELQKLSDDQIRQVLSSRASSSVVEKIMERQELLDLVRRPIMTEIAIDALPDIEAGKPIDLARVYLYATHRKMDRDIKAERTFTSLADKLYFLCEIATEMLVTNRMSLNYREFPERLRRLFPQAIQEQKELDHWHYDMMAQTMLIRNADGDYSPAHRSLIEFFAAYKLAAQMGCLSSDFLPLAQQYSNVDSSFYPQNYTWSSYFQRSLNDNGDVTPIPPLKNFAQESIGELSKTMLNDSPLNSATLAFLERMVTISELYSLIEKTRNNNYQNLRYLGGNAATLINLHEGDFSRRNWNHVNLSGANLKGANFDETNLEKAILRECILERASFNGTNLSCSDVTDSFLRHCWADDKTNIEGIVENEDRMIVFVGKWAESFPKGSTIIDAAFRIHSDMGLRCTGGTINGHPVNIFSVIAEGSKVWIEEDKSRFTLSEDWLKYVKTSTAHTFISGFFSRLTSGAINKILAFVQKDCEQYEILSKQPDNRLFDLIFNLIMINVKSRYDHYQEIIETEALQREYAKSICSCLQQYDNLLSDLVNEGVSPNKPRTLRRLENLIWRYTPYLQEKHKISNSDELLTQVFLNKISTKSVSQEIKIIRERIRDREQ